MKKVHIIIAVCFICCHMCIKESIDIKELYIIIGGLGNKDHGNVCMQAGNIKCMPYNHARLLPWHQPHNYVGMWNTYIHFHNDAHMTST